MFDADLFEVYRRLAQQRDGIERSDLVLLVDTSAVLLPRLMEPSRHEPGTLVSVMLKRGGRLSDHVFKKRVPWFLQRGAL